MNYEHSDNPNFDNESESFTSLDLKQVDNITFGGDDTGDYPDFADVFIESADYNGVEMNEDMINWVNEECEDFVHEQFLNNII